MRHLQQENIGLLSRRIDGIRDWMPQLSIKNLYAAVSQQTMLTSLKELFGIVCIFGTLFLICIFTYRIWRKHLPLKYRRRI